MVRALFLDLDDTLLDERHASRVGFDALWAEYSDPLGLETPEDALLRWRRISAVHWRAFEGGVWSFQEQRRARVRDFLGGDLDDDQADEAWEVYGRAYEAAWSPVQGCQEFLQKTRSLVRVVVTNGDRAQQHRKLSATGLADQVDAVVTPAEAGAWKPDPLIFRFAFDRAASLVPGLKPGEVLMVGDDPIRDIGAARDLGYLTWQVVPGNPDKTLWGALALLG